YTQQPCSGKNPPFDPLAVLMRPQPSWFFSTVGWSSAIRAKLRMLPNWIARAAVFHAGTNRFVKSDGRTASARLDFVVRLLGSVRNDFPHWRLMLASRHPKVYQMRVQFWGTRGSIATPGPNTARYGGNTSCIEVRSA